MVKNWKDPEDWTEWNEMFRSVQEELDNLEIDDPIEVTAGEIIEPDKINWEFPKVNAAFQKLGEIKDKCNRLTTIAKRWYEQKIFKATLDAEKIYPNQELQKAYGKNEALQEREYWESAKVLAEAIHDERSRLFQYRNDLEQMGHNARAHLKLTN